MCKLCENYDFSRIGYDFAYGEKQPSIFFSGGSSVASKDERFRHCPGCGKALTPENFKYAEECERLGQR